MPLPWTRPCRAQLKPFRTARGRLAAADADRSPAIDAPRRPEPSVAAVLESISDAFYALDPQWRFTYLNSAAERLLQRSRGELIGRELWAEFPETIGLNIEREYRR